MPSEVNIFLKIAEKFMKIHYKYYFYFFVAFFFFFNLTNSLAQNLGIAFNGFVKTDVIYDTRQNLAVREGHFYLWPLAEKLDANGEDINAKPNFNILSIQTRLQSLITGPEVFGAKTSAYIEAEFFGTIDDNVNTFRLRHAFVDMDWETTKLRAGQFWHPFFNTDCFAGTISFNTGAPFQPFSRNPQLRLVQKFGPVSVTLAAVSQRDFQSNGPDGFKSVYLRNSIVPELFGGLQLHFKNLLMGAGGAYKMLTPRDSTKIQGNDKIYKTDETVGSFAANAYSKFTSGDFSFKIYGIYGQNLVDLMLPGGYAVKHIDPETGWENYSPFNNLSLWTDIAYGKDFEIAVFAAYGEVLGTTENTETSTYYGRGADIKSLYRVSPRISYKYGNFRTAFEIEHTAAEFGLNNNKDKNKIKDAVKVANTRALLAFYLFF